MNRLLSRRSHGFRHALLLAAMAGCADAVGVSGRPADSVVRFIVTNELAAPVTIAIDDTVSLILASGASSGLAVSPAAQWLTWTSAKPTDTTGTPIPDDIGQVKLRVSGIRSVLEITNVINDTTYVTAELVNPTNARVSIGVYQGSTVTCASVLRAASGRTAGFTKIGYYRLLAGTEIRAYQDESHCTGTYVAWSASHLKQFAPKAGLVSLILNSVPWSP